MAVVDSLEVQIQSKFDAVNVSLNELIKKMGLIAEGISAIGNNKGLDEFAKKAQEAVKGFSAFQNAAKGLSGSIAPEVQKVSKTFEEITAKYKDLGKGFKFAGSTAAIQKQIENYSNALEKAKLKKEELEAAGKTDGQMYEYAVKDVLKYKNVLASLKNQLSEMQTAQPQLNINIHGIEEAGQKISEVAEQIRTVSIPESALNYDAGAMIATFGEAAGNIENWAQAVEQFGERAGRVLNESAQLNININGVEEAGQQLDTFSGQWQNMANLFAKTFTDLKSGALWEYLTNGVQNYVKNAQLAAGIKIHTDDYKNVLKDIERTEGALEKLQQKQRDMQAGGTSEESKEWQKVAADISAAQSRLDSYINKRNEMESSGADTKFSGGLANESILKSMGAVAGEAMASLRQRIGEIGGAVSQAVGNIPIIGRIAKETAFLGQKAFEGFRFAVSGLASAAQKAVSGLSRVASAIVKLASGIKDTISNFSKLAKSMVGIKSASKGVNGSFAGGFKTILKYGLGIRSLYTLFNKLRRAVVEAFQNLAQYSPEVNASISSLKSSLDALKNSIGAAFAPILNVVAPYLSAFIDMLTKAFNAVGRLFAALTGQSFAAQAKKNFTDYAASVSGAGKATKDAGKDIQKGVRAFDELKTISVNKDEGESGGAGGGEISPADMFETVPVEDNVSSFAQRLKDAWAAADFTEIGAMLGTKLNTALDGINWEPLKETASRIGKSIGTLINGFVEVDGLGDTIGRTIGEAVNTRLAGINSFLDNTHWDSVGQFIGNGLNGIVNTVDWEGIGHFFASKFNAVFEVLGNMATTFDWSEFGLQLAASVNTFITDFDWVENGARLGELIKGFLDTIVSFLENTNWQELGSGIADFIGSIDWIGIAEQLMDGLGAALGGLADFLWGVISTAWDNIVSWWNDKSAFGDGKLSISGLLNLDGIQPAIEFVTNTLLPDLNAGWERLMELLSPLGTFLNDMFVSIWQDMINPALTYIGETVLPMLAGAFENLWNNVLVPLGSFLGDVLEPVIKIISDVLSMLWQNVVVPLADAIGNVLGKAFEGLVDIFNYVVEQIQPVIAVMQFLWDNVLSPFVDYLWDTFKPVFEDVFNAIGGIVDGLGKILGGLIDFIVGTFTGDWEKAWEGIKDIFKGIWNGIVSIVEGVVNIIIDGINKFLDTFDGIADAFGSIIGIDIKIPDIPKLSLPKFAKGGITLKHTFAEIGELNRPEAVLPLSDKKAMSMVADSIYENYNGNTNYAQDGFFDNSRMSELISETREQNKLMKRQNELLEKILTKPNLTNSDVFNAAQTVYQREAIRRSGHSDTYDPIWG